MRRGTGHFIGRLGLIAGIVAASAGIGSASASAAVSCSFSAGTGDMVVDAKSDGAVTVERTIADDIRVLDAGDAPVDCAPDSPTVAGTDSIEVSDDAGQETEFTVDLGNPNPTSPAVPAPIEVTVTAGDGADRVDVLDGFTESVDCGTGSDSVVSDDPGFDSIEANCDFVDWAPDTSISSGPADGAATSVSSPSYTLAASEPATFAYSVDGGAFKPCVASCQVAALADGQHQLRFRATDSTPLTERTPALRRILVDTIAPAVTVISGPAGPTNNPAPTFGFTSTEPASFQCSDDTGVPSFATCTTTASDTPSPLADGSYTFRVMATDAAGNVGVAERSFAVDTYIRTAIRQAPSERSARRNVRYKFRAEEAGVDGDNPERYSEEQGASFVCSLDRRPPRPCKSPKRYRHLRRGRHVFTVAATDDVGNVDDTPARDVFRIVSRRRAR